MKVREYYKDRIKIDANGKLEDLERKMRRNKDRRKGEKPHKYKLPKYCVS